MSPRSTPDSPDYRALWEGMPRKRRILVTGVARWWGALVVQRLVDDPDVAEVIGIDIREPRYDLGRADYLKLDIRHSLIGKLVRAVGIDTVVHTLTRIDSFDMDPARAHEMNVIGTLNLLAGCAGTGSPVRRFVLKSSVHVYGWRLQHRPRRERAAVDASRFRRQAARPVAAADGTWPRRVRHPPGRHRVPVTTAAGPAALGTDAFHHQSGPRARIPRGTGHARRIRGLHPTPPRAAPRARHTLVPAREGAWSLQ